VTDEIALTRATERASRAQQLLDDELIKEAFASLERAYIERWRATGIEDVTGREKLFLAINVVGKVRDHLTAAVADGKVAAAELNNLAEEAKRKRRFSGLYSI
jgi:hypothetical protein